MAAPKRVGILRSTQSRPALDLKSSPSSVHRSVKQVVLKTDPDELYAASIGQIRWLQMCLQKNECPTQADINGFSSLHMAALSGRLECMKILVEKYGVSVDLASLTGWRAIHLVMNKESGGRAAECLKYLLSKDADVNVRNQNGVSPLHKAASEGRSYCIRLLIDAGADVHARDVEGQEPIDLCRMWGHRQCAKYLSSAMWKIDKRNVAQEICRLNEIKKECQVKEEESLRREQAELNHFNDLVFLEWLAKKRLPPPSPRILSFVEKAAESATLRKQREMWGKSPSSRAEVSVLDIFGKDRRPRSWNTSANPAAAPVACIFRPNTVRMGVSPDPSVDHDFSSFLFLGKNGYGEPKIQIDGLGQVIPAPALSYETLQRSLYPHAWPPRLRVPEGLRPRHIWDVQRKRPPSPEHRWTDQMAMSLRQTLDPAFVATLKGHLATYSDAEGLLTDLGPEHGSGREPSSPSSGSGSLH